jgi:uncharacterized protein HemX
MTDLQPYSSPMQPQRGDSVARIVAGIAVVMALGTGWLAWEARQSLGDMQSSAGGRLAELGAAEAQSRAAFTQLQSALKDAQSRITELEARVADTQEQRVAIEEMYRDLSRSADDRVLAEVEQLLVLASQQLQLAGNVRGALAALQAADQRLARADKLAATPLRRAITQDMDRLKAVPQVDTVGIAVKLDALIAQSDSLPLPIPDVAPSRVASRATYTDDSNSTTRAARDFWEEMKNLVRIRDMEAPDAVLVSPSQAYFLRENLKLRLLSARVALLARDEASFREDLKSSQAWVTKYFDPRAKSTVAAQAAIKQVAESPVVIAVPDINTSLAAVRAARTAREKR